MVQSSKDLLRCYEQVASSGRIRDWFSNIWNKVDVVMYMFNLIGLILVNIPAEGTLQS